MRLSGKFSMVSVIRDLLFAVYELEFCVEMQGARPKPCPFHATSNASLLHAIEDGPDQASHHTRLRCLCATLCWHVLLQLVCQLCDRQCLQPDASRTCESRKKKAIAAEDHVADPRDTHDLKIHTCLERADMSRMHAQQFAGL